MTKHHIQGHAGGLTSPRERVLRALRHEQPDQVPWSFDFATLS